ncbi:hypothetical protein ACWCXB_02885 [Streptomyces sp. NPDC001514]
MGLVALGDGESSDTDVGPTRLGSPPSEMSSTAGPVVAVRFSSPPARSSALTSSPPTPSTTPAVSNAFNAGPDSLTALDRPGAASTVQESVTIPGSAPRCVPPHLSHTMRLTMQRS